MQLILFLIVGSGFLLLVEGEVDPLFEEYGSLPPKATFYDDEYFNGSSTTRNLEDFKCRNMVRRWVKRALSVDTSGTCIAVCEELDCGGRCERVYPNNGDLRLITIGMKAKVSSLKSCF